MRQNIVHVETQITQCDIAGGGSAEAIEANDVACCTNVSVPTLTYSCLNSQARGNRGY